MENDPLARRRFGPPGCYSNPDDASGSVRSGAMKGMSALIASVARDMASGNRSPILSFISKDGAEEMQRRRNEENARIEKMALSRVLKKKPVPSISVAKAPRRV